MVIPIELQTLAPDVLDTYTVGNIKTTQQCNQYYIYVQSKPEKAKSLRVQRPA